MLMFMTDAKFLLEFYRRSIEYGLETEEEKINLLISMAQEMGGCSITHTKRSKEQILKDLTKNYGKVVEIKPEEDNGA